MMTLEELSKDREIVESIDWDMTPEEAVTLYLEWGNNWSHGKMVKSKNDVSYYFVVNTWNDPPVIFLIRRNSEEAVELAAVDVPEHLRAGFMEWAAHRRSVYAPNSEVREWLKTRLNRNLQVGKSVPCGTSREDREENASVIS